MKRPLIIIAGPTGVGKSNLGIQLAKQIDGEIVSCDSMQVYRMMDIGTAKVMPHEMEGVVHHMIDVLDPTEPFDVVRFQTMVGACLEEIYQNHHIPILVGGTGFYIQSILKNIDFTTEDGDEAYRHELEQFAKEHGAHELHEKLREIDPISFETIHENNVKRNIRALEFYQIHKIPISQHNENERQKTSIYDSRFFVLTDDRQKLYDRIDQRVDKMMEAGLLDEVRSLMEYGCKPDMTSMQGIGYKQLIPYLNGECTLEEAIDSIKQESRHYAKRQITWFKREPDTIWIDRQNFHSEDEILDFVLREVRN